MSFNKNAKIFVPNSTQVPNTLFELMGRIPDSEFICLLYIVRRSFGFHKVYDDISISQFVSGITNRDGVRIDFGTNLSRPTVIKSLKNLQLAGLVAVARRKKINRYKVNLDANIDKAIDYIAKSQSEKRKLVADRFKQMKLF